MLWRRSLHRLSLRYSTRAMQAAPPDERSRLDALTGCRIVDTPPEREYDDLAQLAAAVTEHPFALISFIDEERVWLKAMHGFVAIEYPRSGSPCDAVVRAREFVELQDASLQDHPLVRSAPYVRAYAAVPLRNGEHVVGTLAVMDSRSRTLSESQRNALIALGLQGNALLELRRLRHRHLFQSEAFLSTATRASGIGCWQWNTLTNEITWSDEMFAIFDVPREQTPTLDLLQSKVHPDDRPLASMRIERALRGEMSNFGDLRIMGAGGAMRIIHANSQVEFGPEGRPVRLVGAIQDVTEQRAEERKREQTVQSVMQSQKLESLGVLSAGVAHDFNNLLVGVLGNAELALADRSLSPTTSDLLERIVEAAQRAGVLTQQLLAYTGRSPVKFVEVDLASQVHALLERLRGTLPRNITLVQTLAADLPAIKADLDQLQLLTTNLVMNAVEAYLEDAGEVQLRTFVLAVQGEEEHDLSVPTRLSAGRYVVLEVNDNGCGMGHSTLERALEPFFSTKFTGRGLGLSAVVGIARSHSGVLTVDSRPGEGSRVRIHFPALDRQASAPRAQANPATTRAGQLAGNTVLLVDDERLVRNVERLAMQRAGLTVLEAEDGQQALDLFAQNRDRIDLVVLDLVMPGLDAATTLRGLRALKPGVPVIVQSGYPEEEV